MEDLNKSISLHPHNPIAFDNRGLCQAELNEPAGAIDDYRQALKRDSKFNIVYTHLGMLLAKTDSCEEAVKYLNIALDRKAFDECHDEKQIRVLKSKCEKEVHH